MRPLTAERKTPSVLASFTACALGSAALLPCLILWYARRAAAAVADWDNRATRWCLWEGRNVSWWAICAASRLGDGWVYAVAVLYLIKYGREVEAGHIAACVLVAWGGGALLKVLTRRVRSKALQPEWQGTRWLEEFRWSFPSQHAACAVAFAVALWPDHPTAALLAGAICCSRVLIGAHYVGDVLAGVALGIAAGVWG